VSKAIRALILEDSLDDAKLMIAGLSEAGRELIWTCVDTEDGFLAGLDPQPDVILSDYSMPQFDAPRALELLRERCLRIPFVIVSGTIGEERAVAALRSGATDYVSKRNLARLPLVLDRALDDARARATAMWAQKAQLAEVAVASIFAKVLPIGDAMARMMEVIGETLGWDAGALWVEDRALGVMVCSHFWAAAGLGCGSFEADTRRAVFAPGEALPGRVWSTGAPCWVQDLAAEAAFSRGPSAATCGLRSGVVFPASSGEGAASVLEFFSHRPLTDDPGVIAMMASVANRLGEYRRRLEVELAHARLASMIEALPDLVATSTPDLKCTYMNAAGRRLLGIAGPEHGLPIGTFRSPDQFKRVTEQILPAVLRDDVWRGESSYLDAAGKEIPVVQVIVAHRGPDGSPQYLSTIARDLREQRLLELKLLQSQKMEAFGQLAGGVAHDFNNLLSIILGYCELVLQETEVADPRHKMIKLIEAAGTRSVQLTRQLLAFSRKQILAPRVLDLNALLSKTMGSMLRRLIGEDIDVRLELGAELGRVEADPGQIEQVIMNLAVNARDAMLDGGVLTISTANATVADEPPGSDKGVRAGSYVTLSVTDTGTGMTPEVQARIFEPFFTTKAEGKGTGLGLATVFGIVEQSSGQIVVSSEPGHGTSFRILLPRVDAPAPGDRTTPVAAPAVGGSETVLVVEDDESLRHLVCTMMLRAGYHILEAGSGSEAVAVCGVHPGPIHLMVTDVILPDGSGPEAARIIQAGRPGLKILYASGYTADRLQAHAAIDYSRNFIPKPFTSEGLLSRVRLALSEAR